ncbi:MAG TPA: hypothetical protein VIM47_00890 [Dermatophilaceae bacterium]
MPDPIWQPQVVVAQLVVWLSAGLPPTMGGKVLTGWADSPPGDVALPFFTVGVLPGSVPTAAAAVSGYHDVMALALGIRAVAATETAARALADLIRVRVAARTRAAGYVTPMDLAAVKVIDREANYDGFTDLVDGLWQQHETYTITYQRP